jgi:amino-acid N-acetyltransferase
MDSVIRKAEIEDVSDIAELVETYVSRNKLLPCSAEEIQASIEDWIVAANNGRILGCGSLLAYSPSLAEIRSLAVVEDAMRKGLGMAMLQDLIAEAKRRNVKMVFALTRIVPFFERAGFHLSLPELFPEKIWRDCGSCPLKDNCDELAVALRLDRSEV